MALVSCDLEEDAALSSHIEAETKGFGSTSRQWSYRRLGYAELLSGGLRKGSFGVVDHNQAEVEFSIWQIRIPYQDKIFDIIYTFGT